MRMSAGSPDVFCFILLYGMTVNLLFSLNNWNWGFSAEDPGFYSMNLLMIGKTYTRMSKKQEAIEYLQKVQTKKVVTADDQKVWWRHIHMITTWSRSLYRDMKCLKNLCYVNYSTLTICNADFLVVLYQNDPLVVPRSSARWHSLLYISTRFNSLCYFRHLMKPKNFWKAMVSKHSDSKLI